MAPPDIENLIDEMAAGIFDDSGDETMNLVNEIALEMAGNPTREEFKNRMMARSTGNKNYPYILINPVYGDFI